MMRLSVQVERRTCHQKPWRAFSFRAAFLACRSSHGREEDAP